MYSCYYCCLCVDCFVCIVFFFKQKTAYEMRISDWSSDVCSSDLGLGLKIGAETFERQRVKQRRISHRPAPRPARRASPRARRLRPWHWLRPDRKSVVEGKSVSVRVDLGGRRFIKKKNNTTTYIDYRILNNDTK